MYCVQANVIWQNPTRSRKAHGKMLDPTPELSKSSIDKQASFYSFTPVREKKIQIVTLVEWPPPE